MTWWKEYKNQIEAPIINKIFEKLAAETKGSSCKEKIQRNNKQ